MTVTRSLEAYHPSPPHLESLAGALIVAIVGLGTILSIAGLIIVAH